MNKDMKFNSSITKLISERKSIRTYNNIGIKKEIIDKLKEFIIGISGPIGAKVRFEIINSNEEINGDKLGTYGVIKGATTYIGVAVECRDMGLEELGYEMETLVLYAKSLGLGTCWIAGTFKKSEFSKVMNVKDNELFTVISPIGYEAEKKSFIEKIIRLQGKSNRRKDWSEIFRLKDFTSPIAYNEELGEVKKALENVILAPSALNRQPWRIIKDENKFHFFKEGKVNGHSEDIGIDLHRIDMGIAMCHFDLTCKEFHIEGGFEKENPKIKGTPVNFEYVATWVRH